MDWRRRKERNMVKRRYILPALLIAGAALMSPAGVLGGMDTVLAAEVQGEEAQAAEVINYSDLPELVKTYSPQVQMERTLYESSINRYEAAREEMMETRRLLREEARDMEKDGDTAGAASYRVQAKVLEDAVKKLDEQIRLAKGSSNTIDLRRMEDTMTWSAQSLMGTYHSLRIEQQGADAKAELMQSRYDKALRQAALGTLSQAEADEAGKEAQAALNRAQSIKENMERVRKNLLLTIGFSPDATAQIGVMPEPDAGRVDTITLEVDKWRALGNNYELRKQRSGSSGGTNKALHAHQRSVNESEETMYGQVETLYQDVLANRTLWQSACTAQAAADAHWRAASNKMQLGMLSQQEYLEAKAAYLESTAAKAQADVGFSQALDAYEWAVKGLIV